MKSYEKESQDILIERLRMRINNLEDENECLRDYLNDIAFALGFDHEKVHYFSQDNYTECQIAILEKLEKLQ